MIYGTRDTTTIATVAADAMAVALAVPVQYSTP